MRTLKSAKAFEAVFKRGRRANSALVRVTVKECECEGGPGRVAFVAAKRLGNAVHRNRCKRLLRAAAQSCGLPLQGADVILFATPKTFSASSADVAASLAKALSKAGVQK